MHSSSLASNVALCFYRHLKAKDGLDSTNANRDCMLLSLVPYIYNISSPSGFRLGVCVCFHDVLLTLWLANKTTTTLMLVAQKACCNRPHGLLSCCLDGH